MVGRINEVKAENEINEGLRYANRNEKSPHKMQEAEKSANNESCLMFDERLHIFYCTTHP